VCIPGCLGFGDRYERSQISKGESMLAFFFPGLFGLFALGLAFYLLPSIIGRKRRNFGAIFALNLLLGWTLIGWIIALVWALSPDSEPAQVIINNPPIQAPPLAARFCSKCGSAVLPSVAFCGSCGARIAP
jgi:hypothetical protein